PRASLFTVLTFVDFVDFLPEVHFARFFAEIPIPVFIF
ncbi:hypothetical protein A2U01_0118064, partial [Trifolium medium]|nr:hypothetical protein [Trifolium medium]